MLYAPKSDFGHVIKTRISNVWEIDGGSDWELKRFVSIDFSVILKYCLM